MRMRVIGLNVGVSVATALVCWLLLVPWDLSTADSNGRALRQEGEPYAEILWALAIPVVLCAASIILRPGSGGARSLAVVGTWAFLLTWRTMVAHVVGANMWLAGLVVFTIPVSCAALGILFALCALCGRRPNQAP